MSGRDARPPSTAGLLRDLSDQQRSLAAGAPLRGEVAFDSQAHVHRGLLGISSTIVVDAAPPLRRVLSVAFELDRARWVAVDIRVRFAFSPQPASWPVENFAILAVDHWPTYTQLADWTGPIVQQPASAAPHWTVQFRAWALLEAGAHELGAAVGIDVTVDSGTLAAEDVGAPL